MWGEDSIGLIPEFYLTVPSCGNDFGCLVWMPQDCDADVVVGFPFAEDTRCFPVPDEYFAISVSRDKITAGNYEESCSMQGL
jgi:hypothetical protein